ncbi:LINE-1 reverse transcriptase-like [Vitis vinifera]|uniref:LINE-1 reverse transcriptase-like n=1 Tax=Vitis vinifera TaxID=29760 RepID=A0A438EDU6_VITVI|nr:LINE-1 reverse transcriptase-like [Vitis vinifera]
MAEGGDRNTDFFHRMASAHRRNNQLERIKINGEWLLEEQEIREGIASTFQSLLSEDMGWKADIGGLRLDRISQQEAETLERPFTEEEIYVALMEMNGDKALARMALQWHFGKAAGTSLKRRFWKCSKTSMTTLLAKVLANKLKKVVGKVVSTSQNAFVKGRQILNASLIANEVIDTWQKQKEKGIICKLDIEKAYDSINWKFLVKVLQKMVSGFFPSTKGLRQGDPLSPYLFIMGMEVLDVLIRRAVEGGFLSGCNIRGGSGPSLNISHLFFADDTMVFCEAKKDHLTYLGWILFWFEAASGLRINLAKSEIIPVGEVVEVEELAVELGCRVGTLPSQMPKVVVRRIEKVQRDFLWGGGNMERKVHLVKWEWCAQTKIKVKYGQEGLDWRPKKGNGAIGVGVWKEIWKESDWCWDNMSFRVGKGNMICFWTDVWCSDSSLAQRFPHLFGMAAHKSLTVEEMWDQNSGQGNWNLHFLRDFNDWEIELVGEFLHILRGFNLLWRKIQLYGEKEEVASSGLRKRTGC